MALVKWHARRPWRPGPSDIEEIGRIVEPFALEVDHATSYRGERRAGLSDAEIPETVAHVALDAFTNYLNKLA